jgi:predicted O-linked N-acetylglucosamine transferase (SPINDLY family)
MPVPRTLGLLPFVQVVARAEALGSGQGLPVVIALYTAWIAAQHHTEPNLFAAWFNVGAELSQAGALAEAMGAYRHALRHKPDFHGAAVNLGLLLERQGQPDAALQVWTQAIQPDEARVALLNQRARILEQAGRLDEASENLRQSLLTQSEQPDALQHWLHLRQRMCQWPVLAEIIPDLSAARLLTQSGPLAALALTDDIASQAATAATWIERKLPPAPNRLAPEAGYAHERIRVGYLSSDFCSHAMSYLIAELFERHDRTRFEVFGYCSSPEDGSEIRVRVMAAFDHVARIRNLTDAEAARQMRQDEIDILIDLNGLTSGARLGILRHRPAPVQATYLGFIGPVPLPELDFMLCDAFVVPPGSAALYQPKPLYIGGLYQANDSKRVIDAAPTRGEAGLPDAGFVFCCFSNHYKVTEAMFTAWLDILRQVEGSVMWLAEDNTWSRQNLRVRALGGGIDPTRLIFAPRVAPQAYMARMALADLFLDTFPYNAGTVASDAMRMGLPLLTQAGNAFASRMAARLLHAIGAEAGIASTREEYVAKATMLGNDPATYAAYRGCFTTEAWNATIGDIEGFTRRFEAAMTSVCLQPTKSTQTETI